MNPYDKGSVTTLCSKGANLAPVSLSVYNPAGPRCRFTFIRRLLMDILERLLSSEFNATPGWESLTCKRDDEPNY